MLSWLDKSLQRLNPQGTKDPKGGYTRLGYSTEESLSFVGFMDMAKELGMVIDRDEAGNIMARYPGLNPQLPVYAMGSHLDTVKCGGAFDGAAGVLAALGVVKSLKDQGYRPKRSIEIIVFACEESSRFGVATIGSKAMTGLLEVDKVSSLTDEEGITLYDAFRKQSLDLNSVKTSVRSSSAIHSFVELHIEQGAVLEEMDQEIGIVLGIASPLRYKIHIKGQAGHTGTTPMGKRKDALAAAGHLITFVERIGEEQAKRDHLVATTSVIRAEPNVMNVIPESVMVGIDIRSLNDQLRAETGKLICEYCLRLEQDRGLQINITGLGDERAVQMNETVTRQLRHAAENTGKRFVEMVSGAGHDAMNMAQRWPTGMIFIPCREGISHHPDEYAETVHIQNGVDVLVEYIKLIDRIEEW